MIQEAQSHKAADDEKRKTAEVRNQAEALIHMVEKTMAEANVPSDLESNVRQKITQLRGAMDNNDATAIDTASQELSKELEALSKCEKKETPESVEKAEVIEGKDE